MANGETKIHENQKAIRANGLGTKMVSSGSFYGGRVNFYGFNDDHGSVAKSCANVRNYVDILSPATNELTCPQQNKTNFRTQPNHDRRRLRPLSGFQIAGLVLWRFGLLLAGGTGLYNTIRVLLQFIELPMLIEVGIGLILGGVVLVMVSLVMERVVDMRAEGDLRE